MDTNHQHTFMVTRWDYWHDEPCDHTHSMEAAEYRCQICLNTEEEIRKEQ